MDAQLLRDAASRLGAVVSHQCAALLWGIELITQPAAPQVTVGRNRSRAKHAGVAVHRAALSRDDMDMLDGVRVTSVIRTLLDLCRALPLEEAVSAADSALRKGLVTVEEIVAALCALPAGRGRPAVARAFALLDPASGSVLESLCRVLIAVNGLPTPQTQLVIRHAGRWVGRVDFAWPDARLVVECDGFEFHSGRAEYRKDRRRLTALQLAGWTVLRFSWEDVRYEPDYVVASVAAALSAQRAAA